MSYQLKFVFLISLLFFACEKDLPVYLEFESVEFAGNDEQGGSWKPVLIQAAADIPLTEPNPANSNDYQNELEEIKQNLINISGARRDAIEYWTNNPIIRWNEIALELIAKYNLIPGPNPDDTYTLPNPASPEGPPPFPFANPAYACRALAYLSVAQMDGLIVAWHYKYQYNRAAPYQQDPSINYSYHKNSIPGYPSDGATIAIVSKRILTAMFPLEATYLENLEAECLETLLYTGGNVPSDLEAGRQIGNAIATIALARAANDGMRRAQTPKPVSDSIKAAAFARYGWQWENQELPTRPVGLVPLFSTVKLWNVPRVEDTRPVPPPAIGSIEFQEDVKILLDYADNVTAERRRIANFWQDGLGTYTPPGHWNRIAKEFLVKYRMNPLRSARTFAYLNMAIMDGGISCWDAKYHYHYPRPIQVIPGFKTILGTPNFPSYTSGHSVFSAAAAEVLAYIFPQEASQVMVWAEEAALSRVYGGIHWTFDAIAGTKQGRDVARYSVDRAKLDGADL